MQNAHVYLRGIPAGGYRFIGTRGVSRGPSIQQFTENVIWRGNFSVIDEAFPYGKKHPNAQFPNFYVANISDGEPLPSFNEPIWKGKIAFRGLYNPDDLPVSEEIGYYINGRYFPKDGSGNPTMINVPGRPSGVANIQINQPVKSYSRRFVSISAPSDPNIVGTEMNKPSGFRAPTTPAALTWLTDANAVYNFPNGWYLAHRTVMQERLANGTLLPLYEIFEQWLYTPGKSTI